jgi:hypothetical protein
MKTNRNVSILLENGFHFSTISKMKPNEVKLLAEKFFKPMGDVEQAKKDSMKAMKAFIKNNKVDLGLGDDPDDFSEEQVLDKIKGLAYWAKSPNGSKLNKMAGELYRIAKPLFKGKSKETKEATTQTVSQTITTLDDTDLSKGMAVPNDPATGGVEIRKQPGTNKVQVVTGAKGPAIKEEIKEKFESKAQQGFFWAKCNTSKGVKKKKWCEMAKEFSDSTSKKQYKDMPEKKHPEKTVKRKTRKNTDENYEKYLEEQIFNMIEKHIEPSMTKGELLRTIQEKVDKSEKFMLSNPKKNTMFQKETKESMMKKPIGKMFSLGKELDEDTKEKEAPVRPDTDKGRDRKKKNPFRDPNPGVEEQPKANTREKERTKEREKTKTPTRRKGNPFKDPNPGVQEQPKAEDQKNDFMSAITSILRK